MSRKKIHRAQILLEMEQYEQLVAIATEQERSVSSVIRELVGEYIVAQEADRERQQALEALERLTAYRLELERKVGLFPEDIIAHIRAERDAAMARVWRGEA